MIYERTFRLEVSHLNDQAAYDAYAAARTAVQSLGDTKCDVRPIAQQLVAALTNCHGHNVVVKVIVWLDTHTYSQLPDPHFVVDDEQLESLVMQLNRTNWTVLYNPWRGEAPVERISTELVALDLKKRIREIVPPQASVTVKIWETHDICVEST